MLPQSILVKSKKMIFIEREALCDSAVTDWTLDLNSVNCWKGQSDVVVWLKHSLYLALSGNVFCEMGAVTLVFGSAIWKLPHDITYS